MSNQTLFNAIQQAVNGGVKGRKHQGSFAQRYCEEQLTKRGLKFTSKMEMLTKHLHSVDTYVNLPQLLKELDLKSKKETLPHQKQQNIQKKTINRYGGLLTKIRGVKDGQTQKQTKQALKETEKQHFMLINGFKNAGRHGVGTLLQRVEKEKQGFNIEEDKMFQILNGHDQDGVVRNQEKQRYKSTKLNSQSQKEHTRFLHKATCYLLIALEMKHRAKWKTQPTPSSRSSTTEAPINTSPTTLAMTTTTSTFLTQSPCGKIPYSQQTKRRDYKEREYKRSFGVLKGGITQRMSTGQSSRREEVKQQFTFRMRGVKQKALGTINRFLQDIEDA